MKAARADGNESGGGLFPPGFIHLFELGLLFLDFKWHHDIVEALHGLEDQAAHLDSKVDTTRQLIKNPF